MSTTHLSGNRVAPVASRPPSPPVPTPAQAAADAAKAANAAAQDDADADADEEKRGDDGEQAGVGGDGDGGDGGGGGADGGEGGGAAGSLLSGQERTLADFDESASMLSLRKWGGEDFSREKKACDHRLGMGAGAGRL